MKIIVNNHYKRKRGLQVETLMKSLGLRANTESRQYCHVETTEFFRADMNRIVVDLHALTFEPFQARVHSISTPVWHRNTLKRWVEEHPQRFTSKKFGI